MARAFTFISPFPLHRASSPATSTTRSRHPRQNFRSTRMSYVKADLDHIALDCKGDPLSLLDFYVSVLGFEPYRVDAFKAGKAPFPSVRLSPVTILDFFESKDKANPPPQGLRQSNHFCFAVEKNEFEKLKGRLDEHEVQVIEGPSIRSGARGDGVSIYIKDPDQNMLEFRYYEDDAKPE